VGPAGSAPDHHALGLTQHNPNSLILVEGPAIVFRADLTAVWSVRLS